MLTALSIRNVVLIEALDLSFDAGMTALTGDIAIRNQLVKSLSTIVSFLKVTHS